MRTLLTPNPNANPILRNTRAGLVISCHGDADVEGVEEGFRQLNLETFSNLCGMLAGYSYVKVVYDRARACLHFMDNARYQFHADYIAEVILNKPREVLEEQIDAFNKAVYMSQDRPFFVGTLALHQREEKRFFTLETVEVDTMDGAIIQEFYDVVRTYLDPDFSLHFKPANHQQEAMVAEIPAERLDRISNHDLFASSEFVALNFGTARGRLRVFHTESQYRKTQDSISWCDIIVMTRVPDDVPRVAGIINAGHTTPLSHTNVLAHGWQIPNAIQIGILDSIEEQELADKWVFYRVDKDSTKVELSELTNPDDIPTEPMWRKQEVKLERPSIERTPIKNLNQLRSGDAFRFGTKAANLGELHHLLDHSSKRLLGFYRVPRPPRDNLLEYLANYLHVPKDDHLEQAAWEKLRASVKIPRGIALPFSLQQEVLSQSPALQQQLGKLKMALELNARQIDDICMTLQRMIRTLRFPDRLRDYIDAQVVAHLAGTSSFVVRSSSNAEDLENFSAAGLYESVNHVATAENLFHSIREVWASLLSPRSVRLRHGVGILMDDSYMGIIIQEEVKSEIGGVLVTTNPMNDRDFRNVFINVSSDAMSVVEGTDEPFQYLYNTVEGGGRTISVGDAREDLSESKKGMLQNLAFMGRLLQSHFSKDYTFNAPLDIEWAANDDHVSLLQLRPYAS